MYLIGTGRADITAFVKGVGMLGYGIHYNTMESVETPLSARAFIFADEAGKKVCFVNCELCFITVAIKKGVLKRLHRKHPEFGYDEDNLMITSQHTHSGPGGYSYYGLYNLSVPGFVMEVYKKIVHGITDAIVAAENNMQRATLSIASGTFEPDKEVAFNRSIKGYNANPEVSPKITFANRHLGLDREMTLLKITGEDGKDIGSINWFGVHPTSLPNTNSRVCYDNKGYGAAYLEKYFSDKGNPDYISAFAQGTCGDVTPRVVYHPVYPYQRGQWEGKFPDDLESAKYNGKLQFEKAREITEQPKQHEIKGDVDYELMFVNFSDVTCNPKFTNGKTDAQTGNAAMGLAFFRGTVVDGPGMHPVVAFFTGRMISFVKFWEKLKAKFGSDQYKKVIERKYRVHGKKEILVETNTRRILGTKLIDKLLYPVGLTLPLPPSNIFTKK